jgi:Holliday junction DNA helicase RuvA
MFAFIKGEVTALSEDNVVIDTGNIGYNVRISTGTANLLPGIGQEVKLYTYTLVREDAFQLYGFLTSDDLEIFKQLISVSGIGPKGGLAILSVMSADDLRFAIASGDAKAIAQAPGIGVKTAERLILDLRGKVDFTPLAATTAKAGNAVLDSNAKNEAIEALVALGYGATEAMKAVKMVATTEEMDTEAVLKQALRNLS